MIIFRYLSREVLMTALAVTSVLLLIMMSTHLIGYLEDAAAGELDTAVVFKLVFNRIPFFLELLLPLGLFLGVLFAHGRLYLDSEMVVMQACGVSGVQILRYTLGPALIVAALSAFVSMYLTPAGLKVVKQVVAEQNSRADFDMLVPGSFQKTKSGQVIYAREVDADGRLLDVFVSGNTGDTGPVVLNAVRGEQRYIDGQGRYLELIDGYRYQGSPPSTDFSELSFSKYGLLLPEPYASLGVPHIDTLTTLELIESTDPLYRSRLHWRLSLPVLALVVVLLAVPLAKTNPRRGRYSKLVPSILIYQVYVVSLTGARSAIEHGDTGPWLIWSVHVAVILIALTFIRYELFWITVLKRIPSLASLRIKGARR